MADGHIYQWRFLASDEQGQLFHLDRAGHDASNEMSVFVGTLAQADAEGNRRALLWEQRTGELITRFVCDRMAPVARRNKPSFNLLELHAHAA